MRRRGARAPGARSTRLPASRLPTSLARASRRHLARHPAQLALAVLGVALGVAVVVSIDLANASASRGFRVATESVTGRATHQVVAGSGGVPEAVFRRLVLEAGADDAAPVVEAWGEVDARREPGGAGGDPRTLRLLGVDPLAERAFRPWLAPRERADADAERGPRRATAAGDAAGAVGSGPLAALLTRPNAALLSAATAGELGVAVGDELPVRLSGREERLVIVGLLEPADELGRQALADLAVLDVAAAQELTGSLGRLDRIDLIVPPGEAGRRLLARARRVLPPQARLVVAAERSRSTEQMTRAFRLNLQGLSLLALVCGLFLIYNAMTFSVVQRRRLLGVLRAVGVTRGQVFALVLGEAAALAVAGTAAGLALGVALGHGMVALVTRTINDLYFVVTVRELALTPATLGKGAALGLLATLAAAAVPAWEATTATPGVALQRSQLESGLRRALPRVTALAAALLATGALLLALPLRALAPAFTGLFAVILGFALLAPLATLLLMRLAAPLAGRAFGVLGHLAARGVTAALSRTAVAIAALALAVSVTVGVGVMVESFRGTVERWLAGTLTEDVYVSPAGGAGAAALFDDAPLAPRLARRLARVSGVARVHTILRTQVPEPDGGATRIVAIDTDRAGFAGFQLRGGGDEAAAWRAFRAGAVLVSEPYAWRRQVAPGDRLRLATPRGEVAFPVAAVYASYASDQGIVLIDRAVHDRFWDDRRLSALSVTLAPGVTPAEAIPRLRRAAAAEDGDEAGAEAGTEPGAEADAGPRLVFRSSRELREASLAVFDRTFLVTGVLRLLAGLVAFIGVVSALMALQLERARELGVLRANGMTPPQVWRLVTAQTALMGLAAGLLALPVGLVLAAVMVHVINRRSFGWSLEMTVDPAILVEALALSLAAALLAGLYPARRMAATSPAEALREE